MLALCQKRARDLDEAAQLAEPSCSPHRTPLGGVADSPANKRSRQHAAASSSPWATTQASPFGCGTAAAGHVHGAPASLDVPASMRQRCDPQTGEVLFTIEQVMDIVRRAVEDKERCLRELYDRILQEKLQEQYRAFAKFNEDYISRQLKSSELSYCS